MASTSTQSLNFKVINSDGPTLAHHVACLIGNHIYIHGGIIKHGGTNPSDKLFHFDIEGGSWTQIDAVGSPALSHHACVVCENRYMILIGGWDGKQRVSEVFAFDAQDKTWLHPKSSGFQQGAGLSSHTVTLLCDGNILVIGREGSLRTQRRSGNAFMLSGDVKHSFKYSDYALGVASRSGHTTTPVGSRLVTVGGRSDKIVEQHQGFRSHSQFEPGILSQLHAMVKDSSPMAKQPCGRKHHIAVAGKGCIFIHGGETFDGRSREPVGEMYLLCLQQHLMWFKLGASEVGRQGHVAVATKDTIFIHGGEGAKNVVCNQIFQLVL